MTWTEGSTVGDGVWVQVSRCRCSILRPWSSNPIRNLQINCLVLKPFLELGDAVSQVASCLVLRILKAQDIDLRQRLRQGFGQFVRELVERVVGAFKAMDEDEQQCLLHYGVVFRRMR